ncbi:MAG: hypothetical protein FWG30_03940 [Eubacteriaceae bacterium]|jgi:hypothetical protein|nr:hypothetical protein [Eubacteriaceae bacterium]
MNTTNISIKERGLALKTYAQHSSQHCSLARSLGSLTGMPMPDEKLEGLMTSFREIRSNADLLYKKKVRGLGDQAVNDYIILRNITASFNRFTLELISELTYIAEQNPYSEITPFLAHILSEEKQMLEDTYALSMP